MTRRPVALILLWLSSVARAQQPPVRPAATPPPAASRVPPRGDAPDSGAARPPARGDLAALLARIDEAEKGLADATAQKAHLRDIESLLLRVQAQLDTIESAGAPGRDDDARRELDAIRARLEDLRERVGHLEFEARLRREAGFGADPEGPVVRSSDGAFALGIGARLKFRGEVLDPEGGTTQDGFLLRNAKLMLDGHAFVPALRFKLQTDFGRGQTVLQDYFVEYAWPPWVTLRCGQFKVPFGRQRLISSGALQFTDLSVVTETFDQRRDLGVQISGGWRENLVQWWLGVFNGAGPNTAANDNQDMLWVARFVVSPWGPVPLSEGDVLGQAKPKVSVGGSVAHNLVLTDVVARTGDPMANADQDDNGVVDNVEQISEAIEATGHWKGASLQMEYHRRKHSAGAVSLFDTGKTQKHRGFYAQAGYFVIPARFEAAFRAAFAEPHGYGLTADKRADLADDVRELALVLSYLRYGHHLKLQGEYANLLSEGIGATSSERTEHRVRLQLQLDF